MNKFDVFSQIIKLGILFFSHKCYIWMTLHYHEQFKVEQFCGHEKSVFFNFACPERLIPNIFLFFSLFRGVTTSFS